MPAVGTTGYTEMCGQAAARRTGDVETLLRNDEEKLPKDLDNTLTKIILDVFVPRWA